MPPLDFEELEKKLKKTHGSHITECDVMSAALYPKVAADFFRFRAKYGPVVSYAHSVKQNTKDIFLFNVTNIFKNINRVLIIG